MRVMRPASKLDEKARASTYSLLFTVFTYSLGAGVITTVLPLYASEIGASQLDVGVLGLFYGLTYVLSATPSGKLSDFLGRKTLIALGMALSITSYLLYALSATVFHLGLARAIEGMGWATWWVSLEALTTQISSSKEAGKLMGSVGTVYGLGFMFGSVIGGLISHNLGHNLAFYFALTVSSLAILAFTATARVSPRRETRADYRFNPPKSASLSSGHRLRAAVPYVIATAYSYVLYTTLILFPLHAQEIARNEFAVGILMGTLWFGRVVSFICAGTLSDKFGRKPILLFALSVSMISSVLISLSGSYASLLIDVFLLGIGLGSAFPVSIALISDTVSAERRGAAMGLFETMVGVGMVIGPAIGGAVAQTMGSSTPYFLNSLIMVPSLTLLLFLKQVPSNPSPR